MQENNHATCLENVERPLSGQIMSEFGLKSTDIKKGNQMIAYRST